MRNTGMNQLIEYTEIRKGDRVRVTVEYDVQGFREAESPNLGKFGVITIPHPLGRGQTSYGVFPTDKVELIERDFSIPADAEFVYWVDDDGDDLYARKVDGGGWVESDGDTYDSDEEFVEYLTKSNYGYDLSKFKVIAREQVLSR